MSRPSPSKIVCVGKNYAKHAAEMGGDVPSEPLIFLKAPSALIDNGDEIVMPGWAGRVDYEGEIAVVIGKRAKNVAPEDAWSKQVLYIIAYGPMHADSMETAWGQVDSALRADTVVIVTVTDGDDEWIY